MKVTTVINTVGLGGSGGSSSGGSGRQTSGTWYPIITTKQREELVSVAGTPDAPPTVQLPVAQTGIMVPYMIGRVLISSPNVIWYGNFQPVYTTKSETVNVDQEEFDTVGFGVVDKEIVTTTTVQTTTSITGYTVAMQLGLCLGPDVHLRTLKVANNTVFSGNIGPARTLFHPHDGTGLVGANAWFSGGEFDQAPDPFLDPFIVNLPGYVGIAHIIFQTLNVASSFSQVSAEVSRYPNPLALAGATNVMVDDINPATAMVDVMTSGWGAGDLPFGDIDTAAFAAAATIFKNEGNACSLFIQQEGSAIGVLQILEDQTASIVFQHPSSGKVTIRVIRDASYDIPNLPLYDVDNIVKVQDFSKQSWNAVPNIMRTTYTSRADDYGKASAVVQNLAAVSTAGRSKKTLTKDQPAVYTSALAAKLAARDLAWSGAPVVSFSMTVNRDGATALPGDGIRVTWPEYGLDEYPVVVMKRRDLPLDTNQVILECEQLVLPNTNIQFAEPVPSQHEPIDATPHEPIAVEILTAPYWIMTKNGYKKIAAAEHTQAEAMLFASQSSEGQSTFNAYVDNYPGAGQVVARTGANYATVAQLNANIGQFDATTTGTIASVVIKNINRSGNLRDQGTDGAHAGQILMFVGNEIMAFETVTNNGDGTWTLTNVHRALIDTSPTSHATNDFVYIVDNSMSNVPRVLFDTVAPFTPDWLFTGSSLKGTSELADALTDSSWTPVDRANNPNRPHNMKIAGNARSASPLALVRTSSYTVSWLTRRRDPATIKFQLDTAEASEEDITGDFQFHRVFLRDSASTLHDLGATLDTGSDNDLSVTIPGGAATGAGTMWVRAENNFGQSTFDDVLPVTLS